MIEVQLQEAGVRLGDSCSIFPLSGKKKAFTLNRNCIDLISSRYRPDNLCMSYVELPNSQVDQFHYRLELEKISPKEGRYVLKTLKGKPFWLNGLAAREAYVERCDHLFLDDNRVDFNPCDLKELTSHHFDHEVLLNHQLIKSSLSMLIEGETGTGKTDLARKIHDQSGRRGPFVSVNLSSFNPQLIESELFGHKKGSFTGAIKDKKGALEEAHEGTLFLDEIDSLPLDVQTKLLTFLDSQKLRRVGETRETSIHTRLIFASGRKLAHLVEQGFFRQDFYFRLKAGHSLQLLSLRNDVARIRSACQFFGMKHSVSFTERVIEFYQTLAWPGNLRQLFGHLEKKRVLSKSFKIDFDGVDEELLLQSSDLASLSAAADIIPYERHRTEYVKQALKVCQGNIAMTARKLELSEKTVRSIVQKSEN